MRFARRCGCPRPRVFADHPDHCHRCGRLLADYVIPIDAGALAEALARLVLHPYGSRRQKDPEERKPPKEATCRIARSGASPRPTGTTSTATR